MRTKQERNGHQYENHATQVKIGKGKEDADRDKRKRHTEAVMK
jgi:hypothetical protein